MWRIQGLVGRVLHRCNGNTSLRLPQNHHVEDEVINTSTVLSTSRHTSDISSQREEDGERSKKTGTFQFGHTGLPRYTALDAVGWGAAAVLFMQICRKIHSRFSSGAEPSPIPCALTSSSTLRNHGYRILLEILFKHDVLPGRSNALCVQRVLASSSQEHSSGQSSRSSSRSSSSSSSTSDSSIQRSSEQNCLIADCSDIDQQRALPTYDSPIPEESLPSTSFPLQNDSKPDDTERNDANDQDIMSEERLAGATLNLKNMGDTSVPVILNILGLESANSGNCEEAFICFETAARHGYSKAHFNTGVCYEMGRGVRKDKEKALHHYWQAAAGGHRQAQYRHAKLLLTSRGQQSLEKLNTAIGLLEQSAAAGLTKAQVCLASVFSQELVRDRRKSVHYLRMAAESGDHTALLFLGQCFESGFGVRQNLSTAIEYYKQAARAGNKQAKSLLTPPKGTDRDAVLRSIHSAPCFFVAERRISSLVSCAPPSAAQPVALPLLPHSWSTGSLSVPPSLSSTPLHIHPHIAEGGTCQWTVGTG